MNKEEREAWNKFKMTGKIEDYLNYRKIANNKE